MGVVDPSSRRHRFLAPLLLALLGCGTAVFHHTVELAALNGPAHVEVAVFDHTMGYSREWAHQHLGASPRTDTFETYPAVTLGTAHTAKPVELAVAIPELTDEGYFLVDVNQPEHESAARARFTRYGEYFPDEGGPSIPIVVTAALTNGEWRVRVTVDLVKARESLAR